MLASGREPDVRQSVINGIEFKHIGTAGSLLVKGSHEQSAFKLMSSGSLWSPKWEIADKNNVTKVLFKKKRISYQDLWSVCNRDGHMVVKLWENHLLQKHTFIRVHCHRNAYLSSERDPPALFNATLPPLFGSNAIPPWNQGSTLSRSGSGSSRPPLDGNGPHLLPPLDGSNTLPPLVTLTSLSPSGDGGAFPRLEGDDSPQPLVSDGTVGFNLDSEFRDFEIKGRWSDYECGMYVASSQTRIAQMSPLDDARGFMVNVTGNVNREFVATCFSAAYAMKSEARKRKEAARETVKLLGAPAIGLGRLAFDCISG